MDTSLNQTVRLPPALAVRAAWLACVVNLVASLAMLLVLGPSTAAGGDVSARTAYIVANKAAVQISWVVWIAAALSLVFMFHALAESLPSTDRFVNRFAAMTALLGAASDTMSDLISVGILPHLAGLYQVAELDARTEIARDFLLWDRFSVLCTGGLGNTFYGLAGVLLTYSIFRSRQLTPLIRILSLPLWTATFLMSYGSFSLDLRVLPFAVGATMALFIVWSFLIGRYFSRKPA